MPNMTVQNIDNSSVEIREGEFQDTTITFAGAATYAKGTLLAVPTAAPSGPYVLWANGGADGSEVPKAVLTYPVTATGAGAVHARVLVKGVVRLEKLIEHATGDGSNIDAENVRQLQDVGITALSTDQLSAQDNQ